MSACLSWPLLLCEKFLGKRVGWAPRAHQSSTNLSSPRGNAKVGTDSAPNDNRTAE